jgi:hypothetical protein
MGTSFEVGTALNPYLAQLFVKTLIDTFEPKGTRKQRHEQEALAKLAEYEPRVSKMTESGKKDFYNQFFRAYGMSEAPFIRGLFGAGPEPILPLPEGSTETGRFVKGPLGIGGRMQTQYIIPKPGPFKFEREEPELLMPPSRERELRSWDFTTEDIKDLMKREPSQQQMIIKGQRLYSQAIQAGKSPEEALASLGDYKISYENYLEDRAQKKEEGESRQEERAERSDIRRKEQTRKEKRDAAVERFEGEKLLLLKQREVRLSKNTELAKSTNDKFKMFKLAQDTFIADRRASILHNRLELDRWSKSQAMGEVYLRKEIDFPDRFEDWLMDEGRPFQERFRQLGVGEEGVTPPGAGPPPAQRIDKNRAFDEKHGLRPKRGGSK